MYAGVGTLRDTTCPLFERQLRKKGFLLSKMNIVFFFIILKLIVFRYFNIRSHIPYFYLANRRALYL